MPTWKPGYREDHDVGPVGALVVDQGVTMASGRPALVDDPARQAGEELAGLLRAHGVTVGDVKQGRPAVRRRGGGIGHVAAAAHHRRLHARGQRQPGRRDAHQGAGRTPAERGLDHRRGRRGARRPRPPRRADQRRADRRRIRARSRAIGSPAATSWPCSASPPARTCTRAARRAPGRPTVGRRRDPAGQGRLPRRRDRPRRRGRPHRRP